MTMTSSIEDVFPVSQVVCSSIRFQVFVRCSICTNNEVYSASTVVQISDKKTLENQRNHQGVFSDIHGFILS